MDLEKFAASELASSANLMQQMVSQSTGDIAHAGELLAERLNAGRKALIFGNGGSAADAQHFASELVGRYRIDRPPLPAIALTTDTSTLTSVSNDYGFSKAFARQVQGLAQAGDVVIGISTSGLSGNVIAGLQAARDVGASTIALIGADFGALTERVDLIISVPSTDTPRIQEAHGVIIHILCDIVEQELIRKLEAERKSAPPGKDPIDEAKL